jgi:hypothetical protein
MMKKESVKRCPSCDERLDRIWFTAQMTEEWSWNGSFWECTAKHSLVTDTDQPVICPYCEAVVGTGRDFGFGA